jgi:ethanolamine-phosphate cytidylyltransferase
VLFWGSSYDMMHFGHANSLRQAKEFGDYLIVGVHSDADILKHKGPTVMKEKERYEAIRACKWVDEVVEAAPYVTTLETMDEYNIDYCIHGDDITTDEFGNDCYQAVKDQGRYKEVKRTAGVSTTDLVGRMLLRSRPAANVDQKADDDRINELSKAPQSPWTGVSKFIQSSKKIIQFGGVTKEALASDRVVYMPGAFDLFNNGHIAAMRAAKAKGEYLICGIHTDSDITQYTGQAPLCTLHERTLGVLQCRYVDEVVIGAPPLVTNDLLDHFKINIVVHGKTPIVEMDGINPYQAAIDRGMLVRIESESNMTAATLTARIIENAQSFADRNKKKIAKELRVIAAQEARDTAEGAVANK